MSKHARFGHDLQDRFVHGALEIHKNSWNLKNNNSLVLFFVLSFGLSFIAPFQCFAQSSSTEPPASSPSSQAATLSNGSATSASAPAPTQTSNASAPTTASTTGTASITGSSPALGSNKPEPLSAEPSKPLKSNPSYPRWTDLTDKQQFALRPLMELWAEMSEIQKRKWLALSANFSDLNSKDQEKLQARMSQWSVLSPQQRAQARVIFAQVQQYQGDERLNKWQEYLALDPEKKSQLAQNLSIMPNSAAISPKPKALGSSSNTVYLPAHRPSPLRLQVDQIASKTLLPPKQNRPAP